LPQLRPPLQRLLKRKGKGEKQLKAPRKEKSPSLCNNHPPKSLEPQGLIKRKVPLLGPAKAPKGSNVLNPPYGTSLLYLAQETL